MSRHSGYVYTKGEEIANSLSHGIGFVFALILTVFITKINQIPSLTPYLIIYGIGMQLMFLSSCVYHAICNQKIRPIFKRIDHSMIFVFIFSTYLPISVYMGTKKAYIILAIVGICCLIGICFKIFLAGKFKVIFTLIYIIVGWAAIFEIKDIFNMLPQISIIYLVSGGLCYTIGGVIYALSKFKYHHLIWHIFVMVACFLQYMCIYYLVV